jgi:hypothetical protein
MYYLGQTTDYFQLAAVQNYLFQHPFFKDDYGLDPTIVSLKSPIRPGTDNDYCSLSIRAKHPSSSNL